MHLAVVACGNRLEETLTMLKSALLFSLKRITFHIFAEEPLAPQFTERVKFTRQIFTIREPAGVSTAALPWFLFAISLTDRW